MVATYIKLEVKCYWTQCAMGGRESRERKQTVTAYYMAGDPIAIVSMSGSRRSLVVFVAAVPP